MAGVRLRSDASVGLLIADLVVLWIALDGLRAAEYPTWMRLSCGIVAVLAAALGIHSLVALLRRRSS